LGGGRGGLGMGAVRERDRRGGVGVDAGDRCGALGVLVLVMALGDLLADVLLLAVGVGELVGVLERACELVACGGCFTERFDALVVEAGGEVGERLDAMLELADQRQAGVRELGASAGTPRAAEQLNARQPRRADPALRPGCRCPASSGPAP